MVSSDWSERRSLLLMVMMVLGPAAAVGTWGWMRARVINSNPNTSRDGSLQAINFSIRDDAKIKMVVVIVASALSLLAIPLAAGFTIHTSIHSHVSRSCLHSTPFEAGFYDDDLNLASAEPSSLAAPPNTKLVLGFNKYSHDTSICAADAQTGEVLFALSKERLTRQKHDSGNVALLVESCLDCLDLDFDSIEKVVVNNHHHRVLPMEQDVAHLEWECGLNINGGTEDGYDDEENLLTHATRVST